MFKDAIRAEARIATHLKCPKKLQKMIIDEPMKFFATRQYAH